MFAREYTFTAPETTRLMLIVMISGWTRKTPTPIPFTSPTMAAGTSAMSEAPSHPTSDSNVAMT